MIGIKTNKQKNYCKNCNKELNMEIPNIFNYCPFCGNPLNLATANLEIEKKKNIKLKTLNQVQSIIKDKQELIEFSKICNELFKK